MFITLKLCHVIDWAWWQVLLPVEIQVSCVLLLFALSISALLVYKHLLKNDSGYRISYLLNEMKDKYLTK